MVGMANPGVPSHSRYRVLADHVVRGPWPYDARSSAPWDHPFRGLPLEDRRRQGEGKRGWGGVGGVGGGVVSKIKGRGRRGACRSDNEDYEESRT